jgi:hypothetical protein
MGNMRWRIPRAAAAAVAVLFAILVVSLVGPANLNVVLIVAIVVPVAVIGALELHRLFAAIFDTRRSADLPDSN